MNTRDILETVMRDTDLTQADIAKQIGWTPQRLSAKLTRNSLRADELLMILDAAGVDVRLFRCGTDEELKPHKVGAGRRVRCMVDHVLYDTSESDALSNNFYADGKNEFLDGRAMELYIDREGRYFFAEYTNWEGAKDRITPVTAKDAAAFISRYGTDLHRGPKSEDVETEE